MGIRLKLDFSVARRVAVDAGGQVVWQGSYDPYGRLLASTTGSTGPIEVPMRFAGQWYDRDAGLVYNLYWLQSSRTDCG